LGDRGDGVKPYEIQPYAWIVKPKGEPIFSEMATIINRDNEAGEQFVSIRQINDHAKPGIIRLDPVEWEAIKQAVDAAFLEIIADELSGVEEKANPQA
jgi:hypothetical protein